MSEGERVVRGALPASTVLMTFVRSSVGAKVVMSVTGFGLWAFVIVNLIGNTLIFRGPEAINGYGVWLREIGHGAFVWAARLGLLAAFVAHVVFGLRLAALNKAARPIGYREHKRLRSSVMALTMASSGLLLIVFLVFHLSHTTWGLVLPEYFITTSTTKFADGTPAHDIYSMMHQGFQHPWLVVIYVVGQMILLSHLIHGSQSLWQSLGVHHPVWTPVLTIGGWIVVGIIVFMNLSMPIALFWMKS